MEISTHAPARGATEPAEKAADLQSDFYSRPCERGDLPSSRLLFAGFGDFYSRPCERGDANEYGRQRKSPGYFYSRPCERGDDCGQAVIALIRRISTHAPARGATWQSGLESSTSANFYSRPCERGDGCFRPRHTLRTDFYSRPCERGDFLMMGWPVNPKKFLLTPLREGRHHRPGAADRISDFYSRPCERGDGSLAARIVQALYFYSRPCERGDSGSGRRP